MLECATMAQSVEHVLGKDGVTGSNPVSSSTKNTPFTKDGVFFAFTGLRRRRSRVRLTRLRTR